MTLISKEKHYSALQKIQAKIFYQVKNIKNLQLLITGTFHNVKHLSTLTSVVLEKK